jgi:hypothetical protein
MRVELVTNTLLPGAFVIKAESHAEALILRNFVNWPRSTGASLRLVVGNSGGNIERGEESFLIQWRKESEVCPPAGNKPRTVSVCCEHALDNLNGLFHGGKCDGCETAFLENLSRPV